MSDGERKANESLAAQAANEVIGMPVFERGSYQGTEGETSVNIRTHVHEVAMRGVCMIRGYDGEGLPAVSAAIDQGEVRPLDSEEVRSIQHEVGSEALLALRRKLTMVHSLAEHENMPISGEESVNPGQRERASKQRTLIERMVRCLGAVERPNGVPTLNYPDVVLDSSVMGIAPTAAGKTYVIGTILRRAGIGRLTAPGDYAPLSTDIILPTRQLVDQFAGEQGDDTFRMAFGDDVPLSKHYYGESAPPSQVRLRTKKNYLTGIQDGTVRPRNSAIVIWDEAHTMLGPKSFDAPAAVVRDGVNLAGFTSTPAYCVGKDVRDHFAHEESGNVLEFIETGVLRPMRLSAYRIDKKPLALEVTAAKLAAREVVEGRRVMVVCQKGNEASQAVTVARIINKIAGMEGVARPISNYINEWYENLSAFEDKNSGVSVITTTSMLEQGYSSGAGVDTVIMAGESYSELRVTQIAGRAMRHGGGKEGRLISVFTSGPFYPSKAPVTFWDVLGLDTVRQDQYVGPGWRFSEKELARLMRQEAPRPTPRSSGGYSPAGAADSQWSSRLSEVSKRRPGTNMTYLDKLPAFPLPEGPTRTVLLASEELRRSEEPPAGSKELRKLAEMYETLPAFLQRRLMEQNFTCTEVWLRAGTQREFERWYGEDAQEYLRDNPPPPLASEDMLNVSQIADLTEMSRKFIRHLIDRLELCPADCVSPVTGRETAVYGPIDIALMLNEIEKIPEAEDTDVALYDLAQELDREFVYRIGKNPYVEVSPTYKRRSIGNGKPGIALHVTDAEADIMREAWSGKGFIALTEVAERADAGLSVVGRNLTTEERKMVVKRKIGGSVRMCLKTEVAERVIERLKKHPVPIHLVPQRAIADMSSYSLTALINWMGRQKGLKPTPVNLGGGRQQVCYSWAALQKLHEERRVSVPIRYGMLAGPDEQDAVKVAYTLMLQARYLQPKQLTAQKIDIEAARQALQCSDTAFPVLLKLLALDKANDVHYEDQGKPQAINVDFLARALQRVESLSAPLEGWQSYASLKEWAHSRGYNWAEVRGQVERIVSDWTPDRWGLRSSVAGVDVWFEHGELRSTIERRMRSKKES